MADFDLTLTGEQVQQRLNLVPQHADAIAAIQEAIKAFVNSEQVQTIIDTALQSYSTTTEMNTAISAAVTEALTSYYTKTATDNLLADKVDKVNGKQLSTEDFTAALKNKLNALPTATDLATQISTAISNALEAYTTTADMNTELAKKVDKVSGKQLSTEDFTAAQKTKLDALPTAENFSTELAKKVDKVSGKQLSTEDFTTAMKNKLNGLPDAAGLANQIAHAITDALAAYVTSETFTQTVQQLQQRIADLEEVISGLEVLAEGYVRISGSSSPAMSYAHYKFNQEGAFAQESAFSLFYPCLVGTKLTGDDAQVGKVLYVLQKLGYDDGSGMALDINGNHHAIDGSEGDVMVCNIEKYYKLCGRFSVSGTDYDVFLMSRSPFSWQGHYAVEVERFGQSPDYCISHQDSDGVTRMHSVYNPAWSGSYDAPVGVVGKYVYHQNEETGVITDEYDADATLLGGAGGCHSTNLSLPDLEQRAMNMNPDTTQTVPFMNQTVEACNRIQELLLAEGGTFDAHNASRMGSGFSSNDVCNATTFEESGNEARNGLRYVNGADETRYMAFYVADAFGITGRYSGQLINDWRNPFKVMEAQRAVSFAVANGVGELEWFIYEGNKYKYRSITGFNGPDKGEMTCVVFKVLSSQFSSAAKDPADGVTSLTGKRIDFIISTAMIHGITTQVSPSWWVSGLIFTEDENGNYESYVELDQAQLLKSPTADIDATSQYDFESSYQHIGETITKGEGYARNYRSGVLMMPDTNANKTGGGLHTYVGKYNWFNGGNAAAGRKSVRGCRRGPYAFDTNLSPLTMIAYSSPSGAATYIGGGTCCSLR